MRTPPRPESPTACSGRGRRGWTGPSTRESGLDADSRLSICIRTATVTTAPSPTTPPTSPADSFHFQLSSSGAEDTAGSSAEGARVGVVGVVGVVGARVGVEVVGLAGVGANVAGEFIETHAWTHADLPSWLLQSYALLLKSEQNGLG